MRHNPRSVTESSYGDVFFFLRIFLRPGIMFVSLSEGCNPSSGKGVFVIPQMSRDHARQKHLAKAATAAPRRGTYVIVTYATVLRRRERQAGYTSYDLTRSQSSVIGYRAAPPRGTYVIVTYASTIPLEPVCEDVARSCAPVGSYGSAT